MSVPNLNGQKFRVKEQFIQCGIHKYNSPECKTYICKFKQKGRFVSSMDAKKNECSTKLGPRVYQQCQKQNTCQCQYQWQCPMANPFSRANV